MKRLTPKGLTRNRNLNRVTSSFGKLDADEIHLQIGGCLLADGNVGLPGRDNIAVWPSYFDSCGDWFVWSACESCGQKHARVCGWETDGVDGIKYSDDALFAGVRREREIAHVHVFNFSHAATSIVNRHSTIRLIFNLQSSVGNDSRRDHRGNA
jgi:hypothetical protein